jgi:predicted  nucleic acid-binding Zn-ribbon protein
MKVYQALLPLAAAMMIAGCGSRSTAQNVVGQAESALNTVRGDASVAAPDELKAADATLAHMKQNFDQHEYKVVIADVPQFNTRMDALKTAIESGQNATAEATQEWTTLNTEVPKAVEEIQAKVDSLKPNALPKDVTREELATAKADLEAMKATWTEATTAATQGDLVAATGKGRTVQAKAQEIKSALGMNEQLASVATPPPGTSAQ